MARLIQWNDRPRIIGNGSDVRCNVFKKDIKAENLPIMKGWSPLYALAADYRRLDRRAELHLDPSRSGV